MKRLTFIRPDDWHLHLRDGSFLHGIVADTAHRFARAIVMPNLKPPVASTAQALAYRQRIRDALPAETVFEPLMTLYLTEDLNAAEIARAGNSGHIYAVKFYPAGATTHSDAGVSHLSKVFDTLEAMQEFSIPLLVHGEVVDTDVDVFDREAVFIERQLEPVVSRFSELRVVLEHITTKDAVDFVSDAPARVAATITAHHLLLNRNALFSGGIRPHHYCLPVLKREVHRRAVLAAATSGNPKFFLGTDSAPHAKADKENARGCAGIYTAHAAIELYAEAFEACNALDKLESFASFHGADFYRLPRNSDTLTLVKESWRVPEELNFGDARLVPFRAGESVRWKLAP